MDEPKPAENKRQLAAAVSTKGFPEDEALEDLRERRRMHWLGDGATERETCCIDVATTAVEPVGDPEIPRKPCAAEFSSAVGAVAQGELLSAVRPPCRGGEIA